MHDIESSIDQFCDQNIPSEPIWIALLNRRFSGLTARFDGARSVKMEIADHLRSLYESGLSKGHSPEQAWKLARNQFGNIAIISQEIQKARTQSYKCLMVRFMAIIALVALPLSFGKIAQIRFPWFLKPGLLCFMAACALVGFLITRKRDSGSLRKYALYGAWLGLIWGIIQAVTAKDIVELGAAVSLILLSTFYGLFLAVPGSRGYVPITMMALCQFGVLIPLARLGILRLDSGAINGALLKMIAAFSIVSVLIGLVFFDIRKLHCRLAGVAVFGMVFPYIHILSGLTRPYATLLDFVYATSIPSLIAVLLVLPIRKLQNYLLNAQGA